MLRLNSDGPTSTREVTQLALKISSEQPKLNAQVRDLQARIKVLEGQVAAMANQQGESQMPEPQETFTPTAFNLDAFELVSKSHSDDPPPPVGDGSDGAFPVAVSEISLLGKVRLYLQMVLTAP